MPIRVVYASFYPLLLLCIFGPAVATAQAIHTCTVIPHNEMPAVQPGPREER